MMGEACRALAFVNKLLSMLPYSTLMTLTGFPQKKLVRKKDVGRSVRGQERERGHMIKIIYVDA